MVNDKLTVLINTTKELNIVSLILQIYYFKRECWIAELDLLLGSLLDSVLMSLEVHPKLGQREERVL